MTLDDLECQNCGLWIFGDFERRHTFQERIAPKSIKIDMDKLHFSIERRFRLSKYRFSTFKETCARGHQRAVSP